MVSMWAQAMWKSHAYFGYDQWTDGPRGYTLQVWASVVVRKRHVRGREVQMLKWLLDHKFRTS